MNVTTRDASPTPMRFGALLRIIVVVALGLLAMRAGACDAQPAVGAVKVTPTDSGADISWTRPTGEQIHNYSLAVTNRATGQSFTALTHGDYVTAHLSGLTNGQMYSISITGQPNGTPVGLTSVTPRSPGTVSPAGPRMVVTQTTLGDGAAALRLTFPASQTRAEYVTAYANTLSRITVARALRPFSRSGASLVLGPLEPNTTYRVGAATNGAAGPSTITRTTATTGSSRCPSDDCMRLTPSENRFTTRVNGVLDDVGTQPAATRAIRRTRPAFARVNVGYGSEAGIAAKVASMHAGLVENLADAWYSRTDAGRIGGAMPPWECWTCYSAFLRSQVRSIVANGVHPQYWEIANETGGSYPDHLRGDSALYLKQLEVGARAIRSVDPSARILTPTLGSFMLGSASQVDAPYLSIDFVLANADKIPGFAGLDWHEINPTMTPAAAADDVEMGRELAAITGHPHLAMIVSEYTNSQDASLAGAAATWMGALSQSGVTQASRACWGDQPGQGTDDSTCQGMADGLLTSRLQLTGPGRVTTFYGRMGARDAQTDGLTSSSPAVSGVASTNSRGVTKILVGYEGGCLPRINAACPSASTGSPASRSVRIMVPATARALRVQVEEFSAQPGAASSSTTRCIVRSRAGEALVTTTLADGAAQAITLKPLAKAHRGP